MIERLGRAKGDQARDFGFADLRGADLSGQSFALVSLRGARFDGANLCGASFRHVDLTGASFARAKMEQAIFEYCGASAASFAGAESHGARWEEVNLAGADFTGTVLRRAVLRSCMLELANFAGADLSHASLEYSICDRADFTGALLDRATALCASFADTNLTHARRFSLCREMVVEVLSREIAGDFDRARMIGALALGRRWCYAEWAEFLQDQPVYRDFALEIFRQYPESGCTEALQGAPNGKPGDRGNGAPLPAESAPETET